MTHSEPGPENQDENQQLWDEIHHLATAILLNESTQDQRARLEELICSSEEARVLYLDYISDTYQLRLRTLVPANAQTQPEPSATQAKPTSGKVPFLAGVLGNAWGAFSPMSLSLLIATLLVGTTVAVMAMLSLQTNEPHGPQTPTHAVAYLAREHQAVWKEHSGKPVIGGSIFNGQVVELESGVAAFHFADGAVVVLQGPAVFTCVGSNQGRLIQGRMTCDISAAEAKGFEVVTNLARVVDLGTEFGLEAENHRNTLCVFAGSVRVQTKQSMQPMQSVESMQPTAERILKAGEAITITADGFDTTSPAASEDFVRTSRLELLVAGGVLADARRDYRDGKKGRTTQSAGTGIAATSSGVWNYYRSRTANPADDADLLLLTYGVAGDADNAHYRTPGAADIRYAMPAVGGKPIFDSPNDGVATSQELTVHPGQPTEGFAVVRWTAGNDIPNSLKVEGHVRMLGVDTSTDGITLTVLVAGKSVDSIRLAGGDDQGESFSHTVHVPPDEHIDFVIGCNGDFYNDQTGLRVKISAADWPPRHAASATQSSND